jgi:hypothetical protein
MTRLESTRRPDRFELEAAARLHRADAWAEAIEAVGQWIDAHMHGLKLRGAPAVLHAVPRHVAH